jgi:DNA-binding MarR family transcriptional regulator
MLRRIEQLRHGPIELGPLVWGDIAFLVNGVTNALGPINKATGALTKRYNLGPRGTWVLNLISAGLNRPNELAEIMQIGPSLVSAELNRLTDAGLIVSRQGKSDRRRSEIALTSTGRAVLNEVCRALSGLVRESLGHYQPEELRLCARILADLQLNAL